MRSEINSKQIRNLVNKKVVPSLLSISLVLPTMLFPKRHTILPGSDVYIIRREVMENIGTLKGEKRELLRSPTYKQDSILLYSHDETEEIERLDRIIRMRSGLSPIRDNFVNFYGNNNYVKGTEYTEREKEIIEEAVIDLLKDNENKLNGIYDKLSIFLLPYSSKDVNGYAQTWEWSEIPQVIYITVNFGEKDSDEVKYARVQRTLAHELGHSFESRFIVGKDRENHRKMWEEIIEIYGEENIDYKMVDRYRGRNKEYRDKNRKKWQESETENFAEDYKLYLLGDKVKTKNTKLPVKDEINLVFDKWTDYFKNDTEKRRAKRT